MQDNNAECSSCKVIDIGGGLWRLSPDKRFIQTRSVSMTRWYNSYSILEIRDKYDFFSKLMFLTLEF